MKGCFKIFWRILVLILIIFIISLVASGWRSIQSTEKIRMRFDLDLTETDIVFHSKDYRTVYFETSEERFLANLETIKKSRECNCSESHLALGNSRFLLSHFKKLKNRARVVSCSKGIYKYYFYYPNYLYFWCDDQWLR